MVPTDLILVLRNEVDLDVLKKDMISYFKKKSFTVDIRPISGGEAINFDLKHTPTADGKVVSLKVPVKLYFKKKIMVQGSQESQDIFIDFFYAFNNRKRSSDDQSTASDVFSMNRNLKDLNLNVPTSESPVDQINLTRNTDPVQIKDFDVASNISLQHLRTLDFFLDI